MQTAEYYLELANQDLGSVVLDTEVVNEAHTRAQVNAIAAVAAAIDRLAAAVENLQR